MEKSKLRMNVAAIKKIDPYVRDIVDSTAHVAFYTYNSTKNEWEKTDVEGALFIYRRNAEPVHSIFINNRLNTTSFVEPITGQLELQSQSPFLLYRNERSRIRGFWFYNSLECNRIGDLLHNLIQEYDLKTKLAQPIKQNNENIFIMLTKAQQEFNSSKSFSIKFEETSSRNVLNFFAAAKPTDSIFFQRVLPKTLSVEQVEKQHGSHSNGGSNSPGIEHQMVVKAQPLMQPNLSLNTIPKDSLITDQNISNLKTTTENETMHSHEALNSITYDEMACSCPKPALLPPAMYEMSIRKKGIQHELVGSERLCLNQLEPLNQAELIEAFNFLIKNNIEFIQKLHEAYLKCFTNVT